MQSAEYASAAELATPAVAQLSELRGSAAASSANQWQAPAALPSPGIHDSPPPPYIATHSSYGYNYDGNQDDLESIGEALGVTAAVLHNAAESVVTNALTTTNLTILLALVVGLSVCLGRAIKRWAKPRPRPSLNPNRSFMLDRYVAELPVARDGSKRKNAQDAEEMRSIVEPTPE